MDMKLVLIFGLLVFLVGITVVGYIFGGFSGSLISLIVIGAGIVLVGVIVYLIWRKLMAQPAAQMSELLEKDDILSCEMSGNPELIPGVVVEPDVYLSGTNKPNMYGTKWAGCVMNQTIKHYRGLLDGVLMEEFDNNSGQILTKTKGKTNVILHEHIFNMTRTKAKIFRFLNNKRYLLKIYDVEFLDKNGKTDKFVQFINETDGELFLSGHGLNKLGKYYYLDTQAGGMVIDFCLDINAQRTQYRLLLDESVLSTRTAARMNGNLAVERESNEVPIFGEITKPVPIDEAAKH